MRRSIKVTIFSVFLAAVVTASHGSAEQLVNHEIRTDGGGRIVPWFSADPATAYDHIIRSTWDFWKNMKACPNGVKYFMQHQVWAHPVEDSRGLGGDQLAMALSSWNLLHAYTGDPQVVENMTYIADYYLAHGLSPADAAWPNLPYPYNTELHSGRFDGDMRAGKGFLQPDKAGSFAYELVILYQITGKPQYLKAAVDIADTMARKTTPGDLDHSPWPYRVHAPTGEIGRPYTTNWTPTLRLFGELLRLKKGDVAAYAKAHDVASAWLKRYPMKNNKWGPFFEDVGGWSDTEINADTMAQYLIENPTWDPNWRQGCMDHPGVVANRIRQSCLGEVRGDRNQRADRLHRARQQPHLPARRGAASFQRKDRGHDKKAEAIRQLNWATYMVGDHGDNCYPFDNVWLTDGYGDYVRHFLRAMAAAPELAPRGQSHLLRSTSTVQSVRYAPDNISYSTFDASSQELLRLAFKPGRVLAGGIPLVRLGRRSDLDHQEGYTYEATGDAPGVLRVRHDRSTLVEISGKNVNEPPVAWNQEITIAQDSQATIRLSGADDIRPAKSSRLKFLVTGPYHGKISGTPPTLTYFPAAGYLGKDVLTFVANDGENDSAAAQITINVVRQDLASIPGASPFTTENPRNGEAGFFPLPPLTDEKTDSGAMAAADQGRQREVSVGILWPEPQLVRQVVFRNGLVDSEGNGCFTGAFRLQVSRDGAAWEDPKDCNLSPNPYPSNARASMQDFVFTLASPGRFKGIRISGTVGGPDGHGSKFPRVREIQVFADLAASAPPKIEYATENQIVREGDNAAFGVRPAGTAPATFQWQRSTDGGKSWSNVQGANGMFLGVNGVTVAEHDGNLFRCLVSNGTAVPAVSGAMKLHVLASGSGLVHSSAYPLRPAGPDAAPK